MFRTFEVWAAVVVVVCGPVWAAAGEPKTADDVIEKYIEAIGGRKKLDSIKTMKSSGKLVMGSGMEAPLVIENKRPDKLRMEFTFQGMTGTQAFDGEVGWFVMPFMGKPDPEKMSEDQLKAIRDQADFDPSPLIDYKKKGHQVEFVGKDDVDGTDTYKLKVVKKDGTVEHHYLDAEYFIPIKVEGKREMHGTEIEYTVVYGDYKDVDGLLMPHSVQPQGGGGGGGSLALETIEVNVPIDNERFTMPPTQSDESADEGTADESEKEKDDDDDSGS